MVHSFGVCLMLMLKSTDLNSHSYQDVYGETWSVPGPEASVELLLKRLMPASTNCPWTKHFHPTVMWQVLNLLLVLAEVL